MTKAEYTAWREVLLQSIRSRLNDSDLTTTERQSLEQLDTIVRDYTFENRLQKKGLIARVIVDSIR